MHQVGAHYSYGAELLAEDAEAVVDSLLALVFRREWPGRQRD